MLDEKPLTFYEQFKGSIQSFKTYISTTDKIFYRYLKRNEKRI